MIYNWLRIAWYQLERKLFGLRCGKSLDGILQNISRKSGRKIGVWRGYNTWYCFSDPRAGDFRERFILGMPFDLDSCQIDQPAMSVSSIESREEYWRKREASESAIWNYMVDFTHRDGIKKYFSF